MNENREHLKTSQTGNNI